jgi:hypothetical protein
LLNLPAKAVPIYRLPAFTENVTVTKKGRNADDSLKQKRASAKAVGPG